MSETNPPYAPHMMYPTMMPPAMMMQPSYHWHPAARDDEWNKLYTVHRQLIVEMEKLKGERDQLIVEMEQIKSERDEQETRLDNLAEEMHDTAKDRIEMAYEIEQLERKNDQLVVEMNELRSERDQMKAKLKTTEDESKAAMGQLQIEVDQLRTELDLLKADKEQLKADKDKLKAEKDQLTSALKTQEDESQAAIRQLQAALDRASAAERDRVEGTKRTADQRASIDQNAKKLVNQKTFKDSVLKGTWATAAAANPSANPAVTQADGNFQLVMGKRAIRNPAPPRPAPAVEPTPAVVEPTPAVVEPAPVEPAVEPTPADPTSATKALKKHEAAEQAKRAAKKKAEEDDRILAAALAEKKNALPPPPTSEKKDGSQLKDLRRKELIRKARLQASIAPDLPAGLLRRPKKTAPNAEYVKAAENVLALTRECLADFPVPVEISLHYGRGMKAIYTLRRSETQCLHYDADNVHLLQDALRDPAQWQQLLADLENGAAATAPALSKKGLLHAYVGEMDDALDFVLAKGETE